MVCRWRIEDLQTAPNGGPLLTEYAKNNSQLRTVRMEKRQKVHNLPCDGSAKCGCLQLIKQSGFV